MFRRVDPKHASDSAIGILIPFGARTPVILRLRALGIDLLPARWDGDPAHPPTFCVFSRDEAAGVARRLVHSLESAATCPVQTFGGSEAVQIWLRTDELVWIACRSSGGHAYQPLTFATLDDATREAEKIVPLVWPLDRVQEYYVNTQNFTS